MSAPRGTIWELKPHSLGKHLVLRKYLDAWLPILGQTQDQIVFVDGFAGPGEYEGGEEGSPILALRAFLNHPARSRIKAAVKFIFVEKDPRRKARLEELVRPLKARLPLGSDVEVVCDAFDKAMATRLDHLDGAGKSQAPCFWMVDPFGVKDTPMDLIARILAPEKSEVYISVMYESINRFDEELSRHLDSLYGCRDWRICAQIRDRDERTRCFFDLYKRQLKDAGAEQVIHFDLYEGRRHKYSIFHASRHHLASDRMKAAIWNTTLRGDFVFRGGRTDQLELGVDQPNFEPLRRALRGAFGGKGWVRIEDVKEFVMSDRTDYHETQLRKNALIPMEDAGEVLVKSSEGRQNTEQTSLPGLLEEYTAGRRSARSYPSGTELQIL